MMVNVVTLKILFYQVEGFIVFKLHCTLRKINILCNTKKTGKKTNNLYRLCKMS